MCNYYVEVYIYRCYQQFPSLPTHDPKLEQKNLSNFTYQSQEESKRSICLPRPEKKTTCRLKKEND